MTKRKHHAAAKDVESPTAHASKSDLGQMLRMVALGVTSALLVATPLLPSDSSPELGTGIPPAMLWMMALIVWAVAGLVSQTFRLRIGWTDAAVGLLLLAYFASAAVLIAGGSGNGRSAWNMTWQWMGLGAGFFLIRQLVPSGSTCRALVAVMIALAVGLSVYGYYQYFVSMPQTRAEYEEADEAKKQQFLERQGLADVREGSPVREQFENRLRSVEPFSSFSLTNSLAGALAPWLIVVLGIGLAVMRDARKQWQTLAAAGCCAVLLAGCLVLTKSRTAYLATAGGGVLLGLYAAPHGLRLNWKVPALVVAVVFALALGAVFVGGVDRQVMSEAPKSVLYRWEYWQATGKMIADHPWLGCGPGNFKSCYTQYKLPQASESVADPHNFLLEVWATAGTPAVLALIGVLACFAIQVWRGGRESVAPISANPKPPDTVVSPDYLPIYCGAALGVLLAYPCGLFVDNMPAIEILIFATPFAAGCLALLHRWVCGGPLPLAVSIIALVVLLVNLLAAGGIGFPGVAQTWWVLMAVALNYVQRDDSGIVVPKAAGVLIVLAALGLAVACQRTALMPVIKGRLLIRAAEDLIQAGQFPAADAKLAAASRADPYSPEPWRQLAFLALRRWSDEPAAARLATFREYAERYAHLDPRSAAVHREIGDWYVVTYRRANDAANLQTAIEYYGQAVQRYPNSAILHAQLAWALATADEPEAAAAEATEALRLDDLCPHRELKLDRQTIFAGLDEPAAENAELVMRRLRKASGPL